MPSPLIRWTPDLYNKISKYYDLFANVLFPIGKSGHRKVVEGLDTGSMLDVACGTGTLLAMASERGLKCYGIDTSAGMLIRAKRKVPDAMFSLASFYELPFQDASFDYVVETNAVSGVEIDVERVLLEMLRVCRVGGEIRIGDYATPSRTTWPYKIMEKMLFFFGDYAYDYKEFFTNLGYSPDVGILGWGGMYQYIKVRKPAR